MNSFIKNIVIVGGGTAGWLTAGIIAAEFKDNPENSFQITLIESPDVSAIGVGEGTWPSIRSTLKKIGIAETDLIRHCSVSFKQGSKFVGWRNGSANDIYHHPFSIPQGYTECNLAAAWRAHCSDIAFAEAVTLQTHVAENGRAPKQITTPEYAGAVNYAYHLDAGKFGQVLREHCVKVLGVKHVLDHVASVVATADGDIDAVITKNSGAVAGDLFIDCTGFRSLLLGQHYGIAFVDKRKASPNDCAITTQVLYPDAGAAIASTTISTAQSAGWTWDIGLSSRRGVGYVYSGAHITDEQAERELRNYIARSVGAVEAEKLSTRKLSIPVGYRQKFWHRNCVAIGMAAGFIEPLEASAIALVELSANMVRDELPMTRVTMDIVAQRFNDAFHHHWSCVIDFLKLHYVLSERRDTAYCRDISSRDTMSERLHQLLSIWRYRAPSQYDFTYGEEIFPSASFQYVLYGMGFNSDAKGMGKSSDRIDVAMRHIKDNQEKSQKYIQALPSNRELIDHVIKHGMAKI